MRDPKVDTFIHAPVAKAFERIKAFNEGTLQVGTVKEEYEAAAALGDPENEQHCPLCNEFLPTNAFIAHAGQCILARAPRNKFWLPADVKGQLAVFPETTGYWSEK
jgi:hypothetical protein